MGALNPHIDPEPFYQIRLGGVLLPGHIIPPIENLKKPQRWNVQHGIGMFNGFTIWRGVMLAEKIGVNICLPTAKDFEDYMNVRKVLLPKLGNKPPALLVQNALFQIAGVTRVSVVDPGTPQWAPTNNWIVQIVLNEYGEPKEIKPGPQDPPKQKTENDRLADQLEELMKKVHK